MSRRYARGRFGLAICYLFLPGSAAADSKIDELCNLIVLAQVESVEAPKGMAKGGSTIGYDFARFSLYWATEEELQRICADDDFRLNYLNTRTGWGRVRQARDPREPEAIRFRQLAAIILSRIRNSDFPPGRPMSKTAFAYQASLMGIGAEIIPEAFRLDSRRPGEITSFLPNPEKPALPLWEHVYAGNCGGGCLVSATLKPLNVSAAENLPVTEIFLLNAIPLLDTPTKSVLDAAISQYRGKVPEEECSSLNVQATVRTGYEYRLTNLRAVRPPIHTTVEGEDEIVLRGIRAKSIDASRRVVHVVIRRDWAIEDPQQTAIMQAVSDWTPH